MGNFFKDKLGINIPVRKTVNRLLKDDKKEGMDFRVGENLTPQQTRLAQTTVQKASVPQENFFAKFVQEIPAAKKRVARNVANTGKDLAQGIARNTGSLALTVNNYYADKFGAPKTDVLKTDDSLLGRAVFGGQEVKSIGLRQKEAKATVQEFAERRNVPILKTKAGTSFAGAAIPVLSIGMDLFGGGGKNKALDEVSKVVSKTQDINIIRKSLSKLGLGEKTVEDLSKTLRLVEDEKVAKNILETAQGGHVGNRVVQVVGKDKKLTNKFYLIPEDQADDIIKNIDGTQKNGIAGKSINEGAWHVTAKSPLQMERLGFQNAGRITSEGLDTATSASKILKNTKPFVDDLSVVDEVGGKIKTPIKFFKGDLKEFDTNPELLRTETVKDRILSSLENATAGKRFSVETNGQGSTQEIFASKSSFPTWIPEDLRRNDVIKPVLKHIENETLPTGKRQVDLYNIVAEKMGIKALDESSDITSSTLKQSPQSSAKVDKVVPYGDSITQNTPPVKPPTIRQRGFLTSLQKNPSTAGVFKGETDDYHVLTNEKSAQKARELINNDSATANALAQSNDIGVEAQATRILMLEDAIAAGDINEAKRLATLTNQSATAAGQAAQVNAILGQNLDDPAKALVTASNQFEHYVKQAKPKFDYQLGKVDDGIDKIQKEAVEQIIKEVPEITVDGGKKISLAEQVAKRDYPPAEELASRITPYLKQKKENPVKEMVATLYKLAKEQLPAKGKADPKQAIDVIGRALRDKETYKEVWLEARKIVQEKYADDAKGLALLDKYFDKTLLSGVTTHADLPVAQGQINQAVTQGIKSESIKLSDLVRDHYTKVDNARQSLVMKLVDQANVPVKEANALASKIEARFIELTQARKESLLKSIFTERAVTKDRGFVQKIVEMSNLGAFDKLQFREAVATKLGIPVLTDDVTKQIIKQAEVLQGLEKGYEKFKETQKLLKIISDQIPMTKAELTGEILNIPRTIMSSIDLSFGLRQGLFAAPSFRKEFGGAFKKQFGMFAKEKYYEEVMDTIIKNPLFDKAQKAGVALTDLGAPLAQREEAYMSSFAERIPVLGKGIRMSARAYTGMANKLRMDMFTSMVQDAERLGKDISDPLLMKNIATFVNAATGRGGLGALEKAAPILNGIFFSPRLMASRLKILTDFVNPLYYKNTDPFVIKQELKSLLTFAASITSVLTLAKAAGAEVGTDWRSADFGKIKINDTRIDVMGGFQQYIRMAGQLTTGEYISSTTGKLTTLGEGYKPLTRFDILLRQLENKEAPVASFITDILRQQDYQGKPIKVQKEILDRLTPMVVGAFVDLAKEDPELLPLGLMGVFGIGMQTYGKPEDLKLLDEINKSSNPGQAFEELAKRDPKMAKEVAKAKNEENYTDFDWKARGKGVDNGERAKMLFNKFNELKSDEEKGKLWADLVQKKIITKDVEKQLKFLIANPGFKIPEPK